MSGYPVTFVCMLIITITTSAMTTKLTRQDEMIAERERKLNEAEKERIRANLLRAISHDLRTPLTSIIGSSASYIENHDELDSSEKLELITTIHDDANWLLNMVENLLSVTRIQNDGHKVTKEPELVEEVVSGLKDSENRVLAISHCNCPQRAKEVKEEILKLAKFKKVVVVDTAGISSMYANDGGVIMAV